MNTCIINNDFTLNGSKTEPTEDNKWIGKTFHRWNKDAHAYIHVIDKDFINIKIKASGSQGWERERRYCIIDSHIYNKTLFEYIDLAPPKFVEGINKIKDNFDPYLHLCIHFNKYDEPIEWETV